MTEKEQNDRRSIARTIRLVERYFSGGDWLITFSYLSGKEPHSREAARWHLKSLVIDPLRRIRTAQGVPCLYAYGLRMAEEKPAEIRLILSKGKETPEYFVQTWGRGAVTCCPLRRVGDISALVRRMYAEAAKGAHKGYRPIVHARGMV